MLVIRIIMFDGDDGDGDGDGDDDDDDDDVDDDDDDVARTAQVPMLCVLV